MLDGTPSSLDVTQGIYIYIYIYIYISENKQTEHVAF